MPRRARSSSVLVSLLLTATACTPGATRSGAGEPTSGLGGEAPEVLALDGRVLEFVPSRDDITVGRATFTIYCSPPSEVRVNGEPPEDVWTYLELERVDANRFALPPLRVALPAGYPGAVCMSVKAWFAEVGPQHDSLLYANVEDRYALASFATRADGPDGEPARARFRQNRWATFEEFQDALSRPLVIELNQRPLPR